MIEGTRPNHKESDSPLRTEIVTHSETSTRPQQILKKMNSNKQWKQISTSSWLLSQDEEEREMSKTQVHSCK